MILDHPCDIDGCNGHVDLLKAEFERSSSNWIHYFNCLNGHHYIKVSGQLLVNPEEFYEHSDGTEFYQPTLFDEEDESGDDALD